MPAYEYVCAECGFRFEKNQSMNDKPLDVCPECRGKIKRLISGGTGFIMKGGSKGNEMMKPSCGRDTTCCGSEYSCGKSHGCHE